MIRLGQCTTGRETSSGLMCPSQGTLSLGQGDIRQPVHCTFTIFPFVIIKYFENRQISSAGTFTAVLFALQSNSLTSAKCQEDINKGPWSLWRAQEPHSRPAPTSPLPETQYSRTSLADLLISSTSCLTAGHRALGSPDPGVGCCFLS